MPGHGLLHVELRKAYSKMRNPPTGLRLSDKVHYHIEDLKILQQSIGWEASADPRR